MVILSKKTKTFIILCYINVDIFIFVWFFFFLFFFQTHDHSVCIRPRLPAYNVSAQNVTITLKGHFVSIS